MGKKKIPQGLDEDDRRYVEEKMYGKSTDKYSDFSPVSYNFKVNIKCKNQKQKEFLKLLKDPGKIICVGSGSAGTGKSYISLAAALQIISKNDTDSSIDGIKRIVIIVPTNPAGSGNQKIGYLPGDLDAKLKVFKDSDMYTMNKILTQSGVLNSNGIVEGLVRNGVIQFEICSFAKGKNFDNSIILVNEAEDFAPSEMLLLCTRIGENSRLWITGDDRQCDRSDIKASALRMSGLAYLKRQLASMEEFGCVEFFPEDIVRNSIITKILQLWDRPLDAPAEKADKKTRGKSGKKVTESGETASAAVVEDVSAAVVEDAPVEEASKKRRGRPKKAKETE